MESNFNKFMELVKSKNFNIATLQRLFKWSFPKAKSTMEDLIKYGAVEKLENGYKVVSAEKFKKLGLNIFLYSEYDNFSNSLLNLITECLIDDDRFVDLVIRKVGLTFDYKNTSHEEKVNKFTIMLSNTARKFINEKLAIDFLSELYKDFAPHILDKYWFDWLNKNCPT